MNTRFFHPEKKHDSIFAQQILVGHLYALSLPVILLLQIYKGLDKRIDSVFFCAMSNEMTF